MLLMLTPFRDEALERQDNNAAVPAAVPTPGLAESAGAGTRISQTSQAGRLKPTFQTEADIIEQK